MLRNQALGMMGVEAGNGLQEGAGGNADPSVIVRHGFTNLQDERCVPTQPHGR